MTAPMGNEQQRVDVREALASWCNEKNIGTAEYERRSSAYAVVAGLIEAVRPIADLAELFDDELRGGNMPKDDSDPIMQWPRVHREYELNVGHLRNLRAALARIGGAA